MYDVIINLPNVLTVDIIIRCIAAEIVLLVAIFFRLSQTLTLLDLFAVIAIVFVFFADIIS